MGRIFVISASLAAFIAAYLFALSVMDGGTDPPSVSGVRIAYGHGEIVLNYRRHEPEGRHKKDSIEWFVNRVHSKKFDGRRSIPFPEEFDATVEIECRVTVFGKDGRRAGAKSNRIIYYKASAKGPSGDPREPSSAENITPAESSGVPANGSGGGNVISALEKSTEEVVGKPVPTAAPGGENAPDDRLPEDEGRPSLSQASDAGVSSRPPESLPVQTANDPPIELPGASSGVAAAGASSESDPGWPLFSDKPPEIFKDAYAKKEPPAKEKQAGPPPASTAADGSPSPGAGNIPPWAPPVNHPERSTAEAGLTGDAENIRQTRLHIAARRNDERFAAELIKKGADIDARDSNDSTPLHIAVWSNSFETARLLVANGAGLKARDHKGKTPLHLAAARKSKSMALLLLENEVDVLDREKQTHYIKMNRLVNIADNRGQTPLHTAAVFDAAEVASLLIDSGADVNARDITRSTPLHYAVLNRSRSAARLLLTSGADRKAEDEFGQKPEYFADDEMKAILFPLDTAEAEVKKDKK